MVSGKGCNEKEPRICRNTRVIYCLLHARGQWGKCLEIIILGPCVKDRNYFLRQINCGGKVEQRRRGGGGWPRRRRKELLPEAKRAPKWVGYRLG